MSLRAKAKIVANSIVIENEDLGVDFQDDGVWRTFELQSEGNTEEELIEQAAIFEIDQDGGELTNYPLSEASSEVEKAALKLIQTKLKKVTSSFLAKVAKEITAKTVGKTKSGKAIPSSDDKLFDKIFNNKSNYHMNVFNAHGSDAGKVLIYLLANDGWTKDDYLEAAALYAKESDKADTEWGKLADKAHKEVFKEDRKATDYKVSGVGRDEYPEKYKDKLRKAAVARSKYKSLEHSMRAAAKLANRIKNIKMPIK